MKKVFLVVSGTLHERENYVRVFVDKEKAEAFAKSMSDYCSIKPNPWAPEDWDKKFNSFSDAVDSWLENHPCLAIGKMSHYMFDVEEVDFDDEAE